MIEADVFKYTIALCVYLGCVLMYPQIASPGWWPKWVFDYKEIHNCEGELYLTRWYLIRTPWFALFLHKFHRSDEDRALHDHPWPFIVIPLWRGYIEHSQKLFYQTLRPALDGSPRWHNVYAKTRRRVRPILGTRCRRSSYRHRVELLKKNVLVEEACLCGECDECSIYKNVERPSWSLFIRFRKCRAWGFWPEGKFVDNQKWWKEHCE